MKQNRKKWYAGVLGMLLCGPGGIFGVHADIPVTITATIVEPTCNVTGSDGNSEMEVNFGDVLIDEVGTGGNPSKKLSPFIMKITCDGGAPAGKKLQMFINPTGGTMAYAGRTVLGTSIPNLGIDLTDGTSFWPLNTWTPVATGTEGTILAGAMLVSENVTDLKGGNFTSSALVEMAYH
ncbi:TPA: fimbrial protein [Salmonella enterica subsp. enterica serovar Potsdam]